MLVVEGEQFTAAGRGGAGDVVRWPWASRALLFAAGFAAGRWRWAG